MWDTASATEVNAFRHPESSVIFAAFATDGRSVVTAGDDKALREWDLASSDKIVVHHVGLHQNNHGYFGDYQNPSAISPDGRKLVVHWLDNTDGLWDLALGKIAWVFPARNIYRATFSPDGRRLVTVNGSQDGVAELWDVTSGERLAVLRHEKSVKAAAFSPDASTIVTTANDLIRLWDVASGRELGTVGVHVGAGAIVFSPDGQRVATASDKVRIWPLMPRQQELINLACARVPWPLSTVERERFGVMDEWCTPGISKALRAKLGMDGAPADGR